MKELIRQINALVATFNSQTSLNTSTPYASYSNKPHILSNQFGFNTVLELLQKTTSLKKDGKNNIAFLLGESFFTSSLPTLAKHCNLIILADKDERVCQHNKYFLQCLRESDNVETFMMKLISEDNPILKQKIVVPDYEVASNLGENHQIVYDSLLLDKQTYMKMIYTYIEIFGDNHITENEESFRACKAACEKLSFLILTIDILNIPQMQALKECIQNNNGSIRIFNITNLFDYDGVSCALRQLKPANIPWQMTGNVYASMRTLLDDPNETAIIFAIMDPDKKFGNLKTCLATSLVEYQEHTQQYVELLQESTKPGYRSLSKTEPAILMKGLFFRGYISYRARHRLDYDTSIIIYLNRACRKLDENSIARGYIRPEASDICDAIVRISPLHSSSMALCLRKHHVNFRMQTIEGRPSFIILGTNLPEHQSKIMSFIKDFEKIANAERQSRAPELTS